MSTRVPPRSASRTPPERIRVDIDDLFASERDLGDVLEEVASVGVRLLFQTAIEAEVTRRQSVMAGPSRPRPPVARGRA